MERFSAEEKAAMVVEYVGLPFGSKGAWLKQRQVSVKSMSAWRTAFFFGDLERGLVPRDTAGMNANNDSGFARLQRELAAERAARAREQREHEAKVADLEAINAALGKAIGLLHARSGKQEPGQD